jgi:hypothetical protein
MSDFEQLLQPGILGFYQSCEVTQLFLHDNKSKTITNFFILACFEEKPYSELNHVFLGSPYQIDKTTSLCMQRYYLDLPQAIKVYDELKSKKKWDYSGDTALQLGKLKHLSKQFIPTTEGNRLNYALKNNFHSGSYISEFFDEEKAQLKSILEKDVKQFDALNDHIRKHVPLDLSVVQDRLGNIVFQFPITIVDVSTRSFKTSDGIELSFAWHKNITTPPDCNIQIESVLDGNLLSAVIEAYNKSSDQKVTTGNSDSINNVRIWRQKPSLMLSNFSGTYVKGFNFDMNMINPEPRIFTLNKTPVKLEISSADRSSSTKDTHYTTFINAQVNKAEKRALEKRLSFKQYNNAEHDAALADLRKLIQAKGGQAAYLWDPFLTAEDIINTLFFSTTSGVPLRAIGSIDKTVRRVYKYKSQTPKQIIARQSRLLDNPANNNYGLNLEFRMQFGNHGWSFHDRFLIFPGDSINATHVYSLGTSINSFGKKHHILQEISYPQPVVDAFNDLWNQLNKPDCIVWKYPKP